MTESTIVTRRRSRPRAARLYPVGSVRERQEAQDGSSLRPRARRTRAQPRVRERVELHPSQRALVLGGCVSRAAHPCPETGTILRTMTNPWRRRPEWCDRCDSTSTTTNGAADRLRWDDLDLDCVRRRPPGRRIAAGHRVHARRRAPHHLLPARPPRHAGPRRPRRHDVPVVLGLRGAVARRGARARSWPPTVDRPVRRGSADLRQRLGWRDRVRPFALGGRLVARRRPLVALHMTWGAVNEWTTQAGYVRLAQRSAHPVLGELVQRHRPPRGPAHRLLRLRGAAPAGPEHGRAAAGPVVAAPTSGGPVGSGVMPPVGDGLRHPAPVRWA